MRFHPRQLDNANFAGAEVRGANFYRDSDGGGTHGSGITPTQLYSTASYQAHDLTESACTATILPASTSPARTSRMRVSITSSTVAITYTLPLT